MATSAPASSALAASRPLWTPLLAAMDAGSWPWRMPIQPSGAGVDHLQGQVAHGAEEGAELDRHWDPELVPHGAHQRGAAVLDLVAGQAEVGGDEVDVELDRVGAGLFQQRRVLDPLAGFDGVEAGDHGNVQRRLGLLHQGQVALRAGVVVAQPGQGPREALAAEAERSEEHTAELQSRGQL